MFINQVFQAIDRMGGEKFEEGKIDIQLDPDIAIFLDEIDTLPKQFEWQQSSEDLTFRIKKTEGNCLDDKMNPNFLHTLKQAAKIYLKTLHSYCSTGKEDPQSNMCKIKSTFQGLGSSHSVLCSIAKNAGLESKIQISYHKAPRYNFIEGKQKYTIKFMEALKKEARGGKIASLSEITSTYIAHNFTSYEKELEKSALPELFEKIKKESEFYLKKNLSLV